MRFMLIVKANPESEAGILPSEKELAEMGKFNEELVKAGVMLAGEGLHPSSRGARIRFSGKQRTVIDGPFAETKELVAGYWLIQVRSKEEAIEWMKRAPFDDGTELELRQVHELTDFQNRLRLVVDSEEEVRDVTQELFDIAQRTRVEFGAVSTVYSRTALAARDLGIDQSRLLQFTESVSQALILSGASAQEARGALIQLSQAIASGRLRGDELRSVLEQLPVVAQTIADSLGVTRGEFDRLPAGSTRDEGPDDEAGPVHQRRPGHDVAFPARRGFRYRRRCRNRPRPGPL